MTIILEITDEVKAELARQAAVCGRDAESHASSLLEEALKIPASLQNPLGNPTFGKRLVECFAMIRGFADDADFSRDPSPGRPLDLS